MQFCWLKQQGERDLALFVLGWASSPNAVCHIDPPGCDMLAVHDYTTSLTPLRAADFAGYRRIYLFAWSFGVWVAEQYCRELPLYKAIALNGTPYPTDERYGMRLRVVLRTLRLQSHAGRPATPAPATPSAPYPERSLEAHIDELNHLAKLSREHSSAHLRWHAAYIADHDEMFPPQKMWDYWQSVGLGTGFAGQHNPFVDPALVLSALDPT